MIKWVYIQFQKVFLNQNNYYLQKETNSNFTLIKTPADITIIQ